MQEEKATVKVFRYNPTTDEKPRYETYKVPYVPNVSRVFDALQYIRTEIDSSLGFQYACRRGNCGGCTILINGRPRQVCETVLENEVTLEPLHNIPVIRDLVVDRSAINRKVADIRPYLQRIRPPEKEPEPIDTTLYNEKYAPLSRCIECLACHSVCPVREVIPGEFAGPLILLKIARRKYDPRNEADRTRQSVFEGLYYCSFCGECEEVCPRQIKIKDRVIKGLYSAVSKENVGLHPSHRELANRALETGRIIEPEGTPLLRELPEVIEVSGAGKRVGVFTGCVFDYHSQSVGKNTVDVLKANKVDVVLPHSQVCCGMPLIYTGQREIVEKNLLSTNIQAFESAGLDTVLTICPSCGMNWKDDLMPMSKDVLGREPSFKILDVHEFLAKEVDLNTRDMSPINTKVTYHDPCHLRRGQGVSKEPRDLIKSIPGVEFVEMHEADKCCGGFLRYVRPEIANKIGTKKMESVTETGADTLVTACPLCVQHLSMVARRQKLKLKIRTVVDLLSQAYKAKIL